MIENKNFSLPVRIYYEDTDAGGVVYNANYVKFLERARTEWLRSCGFEQRELLEKGVGFVVASIEMKFRKAAHLDDLLFVSCRVAELKSVSVIFEQEISDKAGNIYITARVKVASVDLRAMRPCPFPEDLKEVLNRDY